MVKVTRRPRFQGTVPVFGGLSPAGAIPGNVPGFHCDQQQTRDTNLKKRKNENNDQTFSCVAYTPRAQASQPAARGTSSG